MSIARDDIGNEVALEPYPGEPTPDLRKRPCNCRFCRLDYPETYDDGELTWWRCEFCGALFDLDDMEILSGDSQACEPCVSGWRARECAKRSAPP